MNKTMQSPLRSRGTGMKTWKKCLLTLAASLVFGTAHSADINPTGLAVTDTTVKVRILHSVTGTMSVTETGSVRPAIFGVEQIYAIRRMLGRPC